jgi:hypothetical protein
VPALALSRVVESGPGGQDLAAGTWQRLGALPDPLAARADLPAGLPDRDRRLRVHRCRERPVHRGRAVDQAGGQADLARVRAPLDPITGQYRAPDEKTIRVVLDPRALARALPGGPRGGSGRCLG